MTFRDKNGDRVVATLSPIEKAAFAALSGLVVAGLVGLFSVLFVFRGDLSALVVETRSINRTIENHEARIIRLETK